jgi:hypothetical protein
MYHSVVGVNGSEVGQVTVGHKIWIESAFHSHHSRMIQCNRGSITMAGFQPPLHLESLKPDDERPAQLCCARVAIGQAEGLPTRQRSRHTISAGVPNHDNNGDGRAPSLAAELSPTFWMPMALLSRSTANALRNQPPKRSKETGVSVRLRRIAWITTWSCSRHSSRW